jgi:hypothetical protein
MKYPTGYKYPSGHKPGYTKIAISLSDSMFRKLLAHAKKENKPFSVVVEDLIKCGFLCLEESDKFELRVVK